MSLAVVTHLNFRGRAREALAFYHAVFEGDLTIVTYADARCVEDPARADDVMWGQVVSPDGFRIMAYDVQASLPWSPGENAFYVSLSSSVDAEIAQRWDRLVDGGTVLHPLAPAAWGPLYGKVKDRFDVTWVLSVEAARPH